MAEICNNEKVLRTSAGDFPLDEYSFRMDGRELKILHVGATLSHEEEEHFLLKVSERLPYGVTLWAASVALAHEAAARGDGFKNKSVLELGAGTGLPGIVAASMGAARVVQTDRNELAMSLSRRNLSLNGIETVEQRLADWTDWNDATSYDWILGSDILYGKDMHPHLRRIFESNLASGGRILLSDPFRGVSIAFLETLEKEGWKISLSKWNIGVESAMRSVGVFELAPP